VNSPPVSQQITEEWKWKNCAYTKNLRIPPFTSTLEYHSMTHLHRFCWKTTRKTAELWRSRFCLSKATGGQANKALADNEFSVVFIEGLLYRHFKGGVTIWILPETQHYSPWHFLKIKSHYCNRIAYSAPSTIHCPLCPGNLCPRLFSATQRAAVEWETVHSVCIKICCCASVTEMKSEDFRFFPVTDKCSTPSLNKWFILLFWLVIVPVKLKAICWTRFVWYCKAVILPGYHFRPNNVRHRAQC